MSKFELAPSHVYVAGLGGTGSHLWPGLYRLLRYHTNSVHLFDEDTPAITLIDGDEFEYKNMERQLIDENAEGINKAAYFAEPYGVNYFEDYLNKFTLQDLLKGQDFPWVIAAVDNHATRHCIIKHLVENHDNFLYISPGNELDTGRVIIFGRYNGKFLGQDPRETYNEDNVEHKYIPRKGSCANMQESTPQLISANAMAATLTLMAIQNILGRALTHTEYIFSIPRMQVKPMPGTEVPSEF